MTAEVAILNKQAVAMAADSAVTVGDLKIFNTVNKLFALSKHSPVGIMVYSSAEIMGVPVEAVVKEFRRALGRETFDQIEGYSRKFEEFLRDDRTLFPEEARIASLSDSSLNVISALSQRASAEVAELLQYTDGWGHPTKEEAEDAFERTLSAFEAYVDSCEHVPDVTDAVTQSIREAIDEALNPGIEWLRRSFPVSDSQAERVHLLVLEQLLRQTEIGGETGIVIAGFGQAEVFPGLRSMEFQCSALGLHNCPRRESTNISISRTAQILPFAQSDVMKLFVEGREPSYDSFVREFIRGFFQEEVSQLASQNLQSEGGFVNNLGQRLLTNISDALKDHARRAFVMPTLDIVSSMPKEELAILAEALINLTSLKRKASRDQETVGGPTDVAIISKGDGLIWISRKHYFDPKLNPQFTARYLEDR
ncbi:Endolysin/autolysin [Fimbriimonadaceae bacterium]